MKRCGLPEGYKKILTIGYLLFTCTLTAQTSVDNHKKYWYYRSRLVNDYVKIGATPGMGGHGESLPFNQRARYANDTYFKSPDIAMGDELSTLGIYLGVLATEYKLLHNNSQNTDKVKHELFCALNAVNRLDYYAESVLSPGCNNSLNGFLMRDDMPKDFVQANYRHFNYTNSWNGTTYPPDHNDDARGFASLGQEGVYKTFSNYQDYLDKSPPDRTDVWMSQDHAISLLFGLSLVNALVDAQADDNGQDQYYDPGHIKLQDAARRITDRLVNYLQQGGPQRWYLFDPCISGLYVGLSAGGNSTGYAYALAETRGIATGKGKCLDPSCVEPQCPIVPTAFPAYHDLYTLAPGYVLWQTLAENAGTTPDVATQLAELSASCNCIYRKDGGIMESYEHNVVTQTLGWTGVFFGWITEIVHQISTYYVPFTITNVTNDAMLTNTQNWHLDFAPFAARLIHNTQSIGTPPEANNLQLLLDQAPCEGPWNLSTNQYP